MTKTTKRVLWIGGALAAVAAIGGVAYAASKPSTPNTPALPPRTANALDSYVLVITSPTPLPPTTAGSYLPALHALPGFTAATITNVTQSADNKTVTVSFTAPPGGTSTASPVLNQTAAASGLTFSLTDTGVAVQ